MMSRLILRALLLVFATLWGMAGSAGAFGLIEEKDMVPASFGNGERRQMDALIIRPDDHRRRPLAVINHGTPRDVAERQTMSPSGMRSLAVEFARRGWVAVAFMRRGYGDTGGSYVESIGDNCATASYAPSGRASADDIRAVIQAMAERPYVDRSKIISVGRSAGGFATVALTANPPPGLVAAISFAGGRGSPRPDFICNEPDLVRAFGQFGVVSRTPMLWVYAENDHFFGPALAQKFHAAFTGAGGQAELIRAPSFGEDGHTMFNAGGAPIWTRYVDEFLTRQGLNLVAPAAMARVDAGINYPVGLSENGKAAFRQYLESRNHKAFVMTRSGAFGWKSGQRTVDDALRAAHGFCAQYSKGQECVPVMIDDEELPW